MKNKRVKAGVIALLSTATLIGCQKELELNETTSPSGEIETWKTIEDYPAEVTPDNWEEFIYAPNHVIEHFQAMEAGQGRVEKEVSSRGDLPAFGKTPPWAVYGLINFYKSHDDNEYVPFPGVTVTHCDNETISQTVAVSGIYNYLLDGGCGGPLCLEVLPIDGPTALYCEIAHGTAGVTALDAVLIQKHVLGIQKFETPSQFIAADVDRDGMITEADADMVNDMVLGDFEGEIWPESENYLFIPKEDYDYLQDVIDDTETIAPWLLDAYGVPTPCIDGTEHQNRTGIKTGDVNGSLSNCF